MIFIESFNNVFTDFLRMFKGYFPISLRQGIVLLVNFLIFIVIDRIDRRILILSLLLHSLNLSIIFTLLFIHVKLLRHLNLFGLLIQLVGLFDVLLIFSK